jgi:putative ABC transport system permease protein
MMNGILQDLRFALRSLTRRPALAASVVMTLALAIGANSALFSVVTGILLRPPPFEQPDRLEMLYESDRISGTDHEGASVPDYYDLRSRSRSLEELAAFVATPVNLTDGANEPIQVTATSASHTLFPLLGTRLRLGRSFRPAEDRPGGDLVAILSEELWRARFGSDSAVLGRTVRLDDSLYTIIGVAPAGMALPGQIADVWVPLQMGPTSLPRGVHNVLLLSRLRPGIALPVAQAEMRQIATQLEQEYPDNKGRTVTVEPLEEALVGSVRPALTLLMCAVGLLLLIACSNVASLLLAQGWARRKEIALRRALGAGTGRLGRQFLAESLVLTLTGAALGVALASWGVELLIRLAPAQLPRLDAVHIDGWVVGATMALALGVATGFGLLPTLQARRVDLQWATQANGARGASSGTERRRLRDLLVIAQVGLSVLLVIGAGLLLRSFWKLQAVDPGFRTERVVKLDLRLPPGSRYPQSFSNYPRWTGVSTFYSGLLERAAAVPGVASVALANQHPLAPGFTSSFVIDGREAERRQQPEIAIRSVSPGYFTTLRVPLRGGRALDQRDRMDAPAVVVINQAAARRYFPNEDPIGHRLSFWGTSREIVGVVGNERFRGLAEEAPPAVYAPLSQVPMGSASLLVRTRGEPEPLVAGLRQAVWSLDPQLALFGVERLERTLADSVARPRFTTLLLGLFAVLALLLASVGIHSLLSYTVVQRTREIGIRMALGASHRNVLGAVVGRGLSLTLVGIGLGLFAALGLSRLLQGLLFGVSPTDPTIFLLTPLLLGAVALLASYLPALRAARTDPAIALRSE